jgi:preprotein translocase subunit SecF
MSCNKYLLTETNHALLTLSDTGEIKTNQMNKAYYPILWVILLILTTEINIIAQSRMPEIMNTGTLTEQMNYVNERTRIYENYRAIREDIFQQMKNNAIDSLDNAKENISELYATNNNLEENISDLNLQISKLVKERDEAIENRDSLLFFGINMSKAAYNKLLWTIIIVLLSLTMFVFLLFKRSNSVTRNALTDLEDIKREFEEFRRVAHENKEKLIVSHFNEIKKLKEMGR